MGNRGDRQVWDVRHVSDARNPTMVSESVFLSGFGKTWNGKRRYEVGGSISLIQYDGFYTIFSFFLFFLGGGGFGVCGIL